MSAPSAGAPGVCPTCGHALPDVPLETLRGVSSPRMARLIREVAKRPGISGADLPDRVWLNAAGGGPEDGPRAITTLIYQYRDRLAAVGWAVRGQPWRGYRMVRVKPPVR